MEYSEILSKPITLIGIVIGITLLLGYLWIHSGVLIARWKCGNNSKVDQKWKNHFDKRLEEVLENKYYHE